MSTVARPAIFLDRDGTLIREVDYLSRPDQIELIPGAGAAIRTLNEGGVPVVLITNQSGIARGYFTEQDLTAVHVRLQDILATEGARLDGIYYCPHLPDGGIAPYNRVCDCRKPAPGMILQAAHDMSLDLRASAMIGDSRRDLDAGRAAGCGTLILVRTGYGAAEETQFAPSAGIAVADDLTAAIGRLPGAFFQPRR